MGLAPPCYRRASTTCSAHKYASGSPSSSNLTNVACEPQAVQNFPPWLLGNLQRIVEQNGHLDKVWTPRLVVFGAYWFLRVGNSYALAEGDCRACDGGHFPVICVVRVPLRKYQFLADRAAQPTLGVGGPMPGNFSVPSILSNFQWARILRESAKISCAGRARRLSVKASRSFF
jgi:hypothetical protein